jgi:hypothetical protein
MAMSLDDESTFTKELDCDPFQEMEDRPEGFGALISAPRLGRNGAPHQGHLDTRIKLWDFLVDFIKTNNIKVHNNILNEALQAENGEEKMHLFPWAGSYVIKLKIFETPLWKLWSNAVNKNGGIYKYRWGDNEINTLFGLMLEPNGIYNLKIIEKGFHNVGGSRHIQDIAPGVKNFNL